MKHYHITRLSLFVFVLFCFTQTQAQDTLRPNGISARMLLLDNYSMQGESLGSFDNISNGLEVSYNRYLSDHFIFSIPAKVGIYKMIDRENNSTFFGLDGTIHYRMRKSSKKVIPYIFTGLGTRSIQGESIDYQVPGGVGVDFKLGPWGYLSLQGEYRHSLNLDYPNLEVGVGYTYWIGKKKEEEPKKDLVTIEDRDQDGVIDSLDNCPDVAGVDSLMGCPDTDGDGIIDSLDECPEMKGLAISNGCPNSDIDNDGFTDGKDECPDVAGKINGCPDGDGDGVSDLYDKCPNTKGTSEFGCLVVKDSDNDGVPDYEDRCPYFKGPILSLGCPDTDGDGVDDGDDRCPTIKGTKGSLGCPGITREERNVLEYAVTNVTFKSGSEELEYSSFAILDKIAQIMLSHPEYDLRINGHTDNTGNSSSNLKLSNRRAETCYRYLQSQGVNTSKMMYQGYGETQPITTNDTETGRRRNRRVEFELFFK